MLDSLPCELLNYALFFLSPTELVNLALVNRRFRNRSEIVAEAVIKRVVSLHLFHDILDNRGNKSWKHVLVHLTKRNVILAGSDTKPNPTLSSCDSDKNFSYKWIQLHNPELLFRLVWFKGSIIAINSRATMNVQKYDLLANSWSEMTPLPKTLPGLAAVVFGDALYAIGGYDKDQGEESNLVHVLRGTSTSCCKWALTSSRINVARSGHAAVVFNGKIFIAGGRPAGDGDCVRSVESFDPCTGEWSVMPPMLKPRYLLSLLVINGCLYAVGGCLSIERYDPKLNCWEFVTRIRNGRRYASVVSVGDIIYFFGGVDLQYRFEGTWDSYSTSACTWESDADSGGGGGRALPWDTFTYGQSILIPPTPLTWT